MKTTTFRGRAGLQHRLEAVSEIIVPFLEKLFLFWALNSKRFEKMSRFAARSLVLLWLKRLLAITKNMRKFVHHNVRQYGCNKFSGTPQ